MSDRIDPYLSWHQQQEEIRRLNDRLMIEQLEKAEYIRVYKLQIAFYLTKIKRMKSAKLKRRRVKSMRRHRWRIKTPLLSLPKR